SDGTIRAAAAALDSVRFRVDYAVPADLPHNGKSNGRKIVSPECSRSGPVAFRLVEGVNHSEIVPQDHAAPILPLVEQCLAVKSTSDYEKLRAEFVEANAAFYREQAKLPLGSDHRVHVYQQFIVRVRDDMGNEVDDYRLDFHVVDDNIVGSVWNAHDKEDDTLTRLKRYQSLTQRLNEEVVVDVVPHSVNRSYRTFFVTLDRLDELIRDLPTGAYIGLTLDAVGPTTDLSYDTDKLRYLPAVVQLTTEDGTKLDFFAPNTSTLVQFTVQRVPSERVFCVAP